MKVPPFLKDLLDARSPSGYEFEAQAVVDKYIEPAADTYEKDAMGNRIATLNPGKTPTVMLAGHMDEIAFAIHYIDDKGFIYFGAIGGHDKTIISGRRVVILTKNGPVRGVTGRRSLHLLSPEERKKVPELHDIWVDIGAKDKKEALKRVSVGDPFVYDHQFELIHGSIGTARAFDDKAGCYVACEVLRRLAKKKSKLAATLVSVATTQEEIGCRGAGPSSYRVKPDIALAIDVGFATDHPDCDHKKFGDFKLGAGPIIARGPNINPLVFDRLEACAKKLKIPYQVESEPGATGTDARTIQLSGMGSATGLISLPLRYMHTPCEIVDLQDIEHAVQLIEAFVLSLKSDEKMFW